MDDDVTRDSHAPEPEPSAVGSVVAGRYRLRERLGRGATKVVYLAYDERLDREVALALVAGAGSEVARARVTREAQVTGRLGDHPHVITVYDSGEHKGMPYLVLRVMRGGSLADRLARRRPTVAEAIRFAREIASALDHAHAHGIVHRDVKPDNVWLDAAGHAALGDFGIAHQAGRERLTTEGVVVGTVRYLSPEQIRGEEIGPGGDLYALGVTLYELVTGRPPFVARDPDHVLTQHLSVVPEAPSRHEPGVPAALERLILKLLAKQPGRRPASAADVVQALAAIAPAAADGPLAPATLAVPAAAPPVTAANGFRSTARHRRQGERRIVSVLVAGADIDDPEALHVALDRCADVIEQHGGSVERYLGDALVGIFGLTRSDGDDALRAARAAVQLRSDDGDLRLGIETGEVYVGGGPRGDAVGAPITAAGRLAARARGGEILLGTAARSALGTLVTTDESSERLIDLGGEQAAVLRTPQTPFVGREPELAALHDAFARVRDEGTSRLVTVVGAPGIGKSRLAGRFLSALGDSATVLAGRCLAYGEGTVYQALAEIVRGLGDDPRRRVEELLAGDEQAIRTIRGAAGLSDEPAPADETSWALRRLLQRLARDRPVVVAVEDVHWAEAALLDLLDHVVALSSNSRILLVCLTRPELLETQPAWAGGGPNRSVLVLDALEPEHALELARRLGATDLAEPIARRAEGNPLFVEQLVAVDAGQDERDLPASIQAVLAARIDRLEDEERTLLQHAAVEGRTFHAGALAEVLTEGGEAAIRANLAALASKGLIGSDQPDLAGEEAFRFTHALIRDAAYAAIPKGLRARLHGGLAGWLERRPGAPDEIVGYHLEQAVALATELGVAGDAEQVLATRAVGRLESAARGALARGDPAAASSLQERAIALVADDAARAARLPALGASLFESGEMGEATRVLAEAIARAPDPRSEARARIEREFVRLEADPGVELDETLRVADAALPVLEGDDEALCRLWSLRAQVAWIRGRLADADAAWGDAALHAERAGHERELFHVLGWRATAAVLGPSPVPEAIRLCEEIAEIVAPSAVSVAWTHNALAVVHAMNAQFELAEDYLRQANATLDQIGSLTSRVSHHEAFVRMLAGRPDLAELPLRSGLERLEPLQDLGLLATTAAMLAQAVYAQGHVREADELCEKAAAAVTPDDIVTHAWWRSVRAKVLAAGGRCDEALALAREAVELIESTDLLSHRADAMLDLAEVLRVCSRHGECRGAMQTALQLYEAKGNIAAATRTSALLESRAG